MSQGTIPSDKIRENLRAELESTQEAYHQLLADVPDNAWELPTSNPAWNVRQLLNHIIMAHKYLPQDIKMIRSGRMMAPPAWLFNWLNIYITRWQAHGQDRDGLIAKYDAAHDTIIALLETIQPNEWELQGPYPAINNNLGGNQTIADMFHYLTIHFHEHAMDVSAAIAPKPTPSDSNSTLIEGTTLQPIKDNASMNEPFQQKDSGFLTYPTGGWRKAMFKYPVYLWRLGFGPLMGKLFVLITTTGRKSGLPRRTLTEYHSLNGKKYTPSGFGRRAQWYKNIEVDPHITIQTDAGTEGVIAVRVTEDSEVLELVDVMEKKDGVAMRNLYLNALEIEPTPEDILAKKDRMYWLRFDPTDEPTPPPQNADLVWIWPVTAVVTLLSILILKKLLRISS